VPRLRVDQLLNFAWKFMLPMALINLVVAGIWHFTGVWHFAGASLVRWLFCGALIGVPYVCLGRALSVAKNSRNAFIGLPPEMGIPFAIIAALTLVSAIAA